jgi:hypothetical protein
MIFLATTAEEKGLLGADYFGHHPTVPIAQIVGNVDLDMPLLLYSFTDLIAFGANHSTIGRQVAEAVAPMNISLSADPMPEQGVFTRSDHYQLVRQGVPAVMLATGMANGGDKSWVSSSKAPITARAMTFRRPSTGKRARNSRRSIPHYACDGRCEHATPVVPRRLFRRHLRAECRARPAMTPKASGMLRNDAL